MAFKKGRWPIILRHREEDGSESIIVKVVDGYFSSGNVFYHKNYPSERYWVLTDKMTGRRIYDAKTRRDCADWYEWNYQKVLDKRLTEEYAEWCNQFSELVKESEVLHE